MDISLEQAYYVGELISAGVVIFSLIYLAQQVRQNTRSTRLSTAQAISNEYHNWYDTVASNRELADIWHRGTFDFHSLDPTEKVQFTLTMTRVFRTWHEQHYQWREQALDDEFWQSWVIQLKDAMQHSGWREVWARRKHHYTKSFQGLVDKLIAEAKDTKPLYDPPTS